MTTLLHRAVYEIVPRKDPTLRVEVAYSSNVDGAPVVLAPYSNTAAQRWIAMEHPLSPGTFAFVPEVAASRALAWKRGSPTVQIWSRKDESTATESIADVHQQIYVVPAAAEGSSDGGWCTLFCKVHLPMNSDSNLDNCSGNNNASGNGLAQGNPDAQQLLAKLAVLMNFDCILGLSKSATGELTLAWQGGTSGSTAADSSIDLTSPAARGSPCSDHVKLVERSRVWALDSCEEILSPRLTAVEEFPFRSRVVLPEDVHKAIHDINERCRENAAVFTDAAFPCDETSLNGRRFPCKARLSGRVPDVAPCDWMRPVHLSTATPSMTPSTTLLQRSRAQPQTQQQDHHSCSIAGYDYFGVLLDAVVTSPLLHRGGSFLGDSVIPNEYNPFGVYAVRLHLNRREFYVLVDDCLPARSGDACFLRCGDSKSSEDPNGGRYCSWWPSIVQKACAKILGSYYHLHKDVEVDGLGDEKIEALFEALSSGRSLRSSTNDGTWQRVLARTLGTTSSSGGEGCCVAWTVDKSARTAGFSGLGLLVEHPYTVLGLITDAVGGGDNDEAPAQQCAAKKATTTLVKLRQPYHHGNGGQSAAEWQGQWSHSDEASWSNTSENIRSQRCPAAASSSLGHSRHRHTNNSNAEDDDDAAAPQSYVCMSLRDFGRYFDAISTVTVPTKYLPYEAVVEGPWLAHSCLQRDDALGNMHALLTLEEEGKPFEITLSRIDGVVGYQAPLRAAAFLLSTLEPPERPQLLTNPLATSPWARRTTTVSIPSGTPRGGGVFVVIAPLMCGDIVSSNSETAAQAAPSTLDGNDSAVSFRATRPSFRIHVCSATKLSLTLLPHPQITALCLPWTMPENQVSPTVPMQLVVGSNCSSGGGGGLNSAIKKWSVPGVLLCDTTPLNPQPPNCRDVFAAAVDRASGIVAVKRTDSNSGWEQILRLRCTVRSRIQLVVTSYTPVSVTIDAASTPTDHACYEIAPRHAPELRLTVDSILKDSASHSNNGAAIRVEPHNGNASQRFRLKQCATGVFLVYSVFAPTKALQCTALNTTPVELWDAVPTNAAQQFSFLPTSGGYCRIVRPGGKGMVEVTGCGRDGAGLRAVQASGATATPHAEFKLIAAPSAADSAVVSVLLLDRAGKAIVLSSGRFPQTISSVELPPGTYHLCLYCSAPQEFLNILVASAAHVKCTTE